MIGDLGWAMIFVLSTWVVLAIILCEWQAKRRYAEGRVDAQREIFEQINIFFDEGKTIYTKPMWIESKGEPVSIFHCAFYGLDYNSTAMTIN